VRLKKKAKKASKRQKPSLTLGRRTNEVGKVDEIALRLDNIPLEKKQKPALI